MKKLLYLLILLSAPTWAFSQTRGPVRKKPAPVAAPVAKHLLRGIVTYYFNENYGDRPDTGSVAYILDEKAQDELKINWSVIADYQESYTAGQTDNKTPEEHEAYMNLNARDNLALEEVLKIKASGAKTATADGAGVYQATLPAGSYRVIVVSAHRKRVTKTEVMGQVRVYSFKLSDDKEIATRFAF